MIVSELGVFVEDLEIKIHNENNAEPKICASRQGN
jgi:hypothetical protein